MRRSCRSNPDTKIPAIIDPDGPDGTPVGLIDSGAIFLYMASQTGMLGGSGARRAQVTQWLMWQMAGLGPVLAQLAYFGQVRGRRDLGIRARGSATQSRRSACWPSRTGRWRTADRSRVSFSIADIAIALWLNALD